MAELRRLSLAAAVLINLNIIVGSGIFINTVILAQLAGIASALTYVLVGLLVLPLMISFACLARRHQGGSLYSYSAGLGSYPAFFSIWGYALTKLASCAVAIHVCASLLSSIIPLLARAPILTVDLCILSLFTVLNCYHAHVGTKLQRLFVVGKMVPIGTVLVLGSWYFSSAMVPATLATSLSGVFAGIPFVLYAFMGFEASAGFNRQLVDPERNGWRAMAISFVIGVVVTTLFQWLLFGSVPHIAQLSSYRDLFPALLASWHLSDSLRTVALVFLHGGIAVSAAGVGFGILYANAGNFFELAEHKFIPRIVGYRNESYTPVYCLLLEALLVALYLTVGYQSLPMLQQLAACGATCTYVVSVIALFKDYSSSSRVRTVAVLGLLSCAVLLCAVLRNFVVISSLPLLLFVAIHLIGLAFYSTATLVRRTI